LTPQIREATRADAAALARLRYEFRSSQGEPIETEDEFVERCAPWFDAELAREDGWRCWVLVVDGAIVGHLWLDLIRKIPNPVDEREHHAYISNFYVCDAYRARGAGTRMMQAALDWCREHDVDSVVLWPTTASRSLYLRHGFTAPEELLELRPATSAT
jgi:GNAT superfamily N-acetyltransferase